MRVTFDRGARLDDTRAFVTTRCVAIARGASRACSCGARARRPCTHHGCVCLGPLADRARRARRRGRFTRVFDRYCLTGGRGHEQGRSAVGNRLALRVRAAICARVSLGATVSAPAKSHPAALFADTSSPNCYQSALFLAKTSVCACPPLACGAHTDARARTPRVSRETSRLARALRRDSHRTHDRHADKTMRPPAGRGFGGGGRGFGGRSPGGRGFGGRGGRGGRGGFDEGPPDTVVGAFSYASRSLHASRSAGGRVERRPAHSARRNCWFTLVASGGVGVKSAAALSPLSLR